LATRFLSTPSALVQEQEFAKQLRIARYLAGASLPTARVLEPVTKARTPKQERAVTKARPKAKAEPARQKAGEAELAKERRRAQQLGRHKGHHPARVGAKSSDLGVVGENLLNLAAELSIDLTSGMDTSVCNLFPPNPIGSMIRILQI
jgi:hypothetical protein